jgi:hypothetical protein
MKLDIYREARGASIKPGMVVETVAGDDRPRPIEVDEVHVKRGGMIDLVGYFAHGPRRDENRQTLHVRDSETLRVRPTAQEVLGVWSSLCDAVKSAAAQFVEDQELDGDDRQAPPWEVVGQLGELLVSYRFQGYRIDPDLPMPEDDPEDEGG